MKYELPFFEIKSIKKAYQLSASCLHHHGQQKVKQGSNRCCYANRHITTAAIILYG